MQSLAIVSLCSIIIKTSDDKFLMMMSSMVSDEVVSTTVETIGDSDIVD